MKENAIKEIKNISAKIAIESVIRIINTSIDKSKLDKIFEQNLEEAKTAFKK
jgi:F-type H+-transporting ATPase subunit b